LYSHPRPYGTGLWPVYPRYRPVQPGTVCYGLGCLDESTGLGLGFRMLHLSIAMAISKDLLEILVCPLCKAPLELKQDENGLKCVECKRVYPIRDDIPVMLVEEARIEE
jgi:uncharacterized protein YbaR (Trm112 family)